MDEYYCPNCGATLNDQEGFDPSKSTWTCTECGQRLMDDDVYEGDKFRGVAWYCDNCGALLNKQYGFSDSTGTWICTECGHTNGTTEEDILEDDEIIECPSCGGALNKQSGFSDYAYDWNCTFCGAHLHRQYSCDNFEVLDENLKCPNCDEYLLDQFGFSEYSDDWTCTECGAHLHRDYSIDPYKVVEQSCDDEIDNDYFDESDSSDDGYYEEDDEDRNSTIESTSHQPHSFATPTPHKKHWSRRKKKKLIKRLFIIFLIVFLIYYIGYYILLEFKKIEIGCDSNSLLGQNYESVVEELTDSGFINVFVYPLNDLSLSDEEFSDMIESISIDGDNEFSGNDKYLDTAEIIIYYHSLKLISPPIDSKSAKGEDYNSIKQQFEGAGFVNIKLEIVYDLF